MQKKLPLLICILITWANNTIAQNIYYTNCDSFEIGDSFKTTQLPEEWKTRTFKQQYIYCSPDSNTNKLGHLKFNSEVVCTEFVDIIEVDSTLMIVGDFRNYKVYNKVTRWCKIKYENSFGFVLETQLATGYNKDGNYLISDNSSLYGNGVLIKAVKDGPNGNQILQEYWFEKMHGYRLHEIKSSTFSKEGYLICFETYRESCPGANRYELVLLHQKGFTPLTSSFCTGEAGTFDCEEIFIPLEMEDGTVELAPLGVLLAEKSNRKWRKEDFSSYKYPENIGIPKENLIVKTHSFTEDILDENGNPVMENDYEYKVNVITNDPKYYQWNHSELKELGSFAFLNIVDSVQNAAIQLDALNNKLQLEIKALKNVEKEKSSHLVLVPKTTNDSSKYYFGILAFLFTAILFYAIGKGKEKAV